MAPHSQQFHILLVGGYCFFLRWAQLALATEILGAFYLFLPVVWPLQYCNWEWLVVLQDDDEARARRQSKKQVEFVGNLLGLVWFGLICFGLVARLIDLVC